MILQVFAVYDSKAKAFAHPFFCPNAELAKRYFADGANDPTLQLCKNAEDFSLFHLGEWNDADATFTLNTAPAPLGFAANFKKVNS